MTTRGDLVHLLCVTRIEASLFRSKSKRKVYVPSDSGDFLTLLETSRMIYRCLSRMETSGGLADLAQTSIMVKGALERVEGMRIASRVCQTMFGQHRRPH